MALAYSKYTAFAVAEYLHFTLAFNQPQKPFIAHYTPLP